MKIVLTEDVVGVGDIGDTVKVRPGYARNYLIPRGLAVELGSKSAGFLKHKTQQIEAKKSRLKGEAAELSAKVENLSIEFGLRVGSGGKVFGSIGTRDIAERLSQEGIVLDRRRVLLSEPIRRPGEYEVRVKLHSEVVSQLKIKVNKLKATKAEEEAEAEQARQRIEEQVAESSVTEEEKEALEALGVDEESSAEPDNAQ